MLKMRLAVITEMESLTNFLLIGIANRKCKYRRYGLLCKYNKDDRVLDGSIS